MRRIAQATPIVLLGGLLALPDDQRTDTMHVMPRTNAWFQGRGTAFTNAAGYLAGIAGTGRSVQLSRDRRCVGTSGPGGCP